MITLGYVYIALDLFRDNLNFQTSREEHPEFKKVIFFTHISQINVIEMYARHIIQLFYYTSIFDFVICEGTLCV